MPKSERVLILLPAAYPGGGAQALRMQLFADGLAKAGCECRVLGAVFKEGDGHSSESQHMGWLRDARNVLYRNASVGGGATVGETLLRVTKQVYREWAFSVLLAYGPFWSPIGPSVTFFRVLGVNIIADCTEWYAFRVWRVFAPAYWDHLSFRRHLQELSGGIAISRFWEEKLLKLGVPVLRIPAIADVAGCSDTKAPVAVESAALTIGYFGALSKRNLIRTLLAGIRLVKVAGADVRLACIGHHPLPRRHAVRLKVGRDRYLSACVTLEGRLSSRQEALQRMRECDALVLLRDGDVASVGCFPTRLPEYLLSFRPVITSAVGDIANLLRDQESAYFVPAGHRPKELASVVFDIIADRGKAARIGERGAELAKREFCHIQWGTRLAGFLASLRSR